MDIYAKPGTKLKYNGAVGTYAGCSPASLLSFNIIYTLLSVDMHNCYTNIKLAELPQYEFNSVWFDHATELD